MKSNNLLSSFIFFSENGTEDGNFSRNETWLYEKI